ncbi:hypothetical protein D7223_04670 [Micromonospora endolithica]|uniref:Uncharacterized protein n=2 Tax=Micromonospora endolithica TaxID=230091 RepID=A0A3A9ZSV6_9ACTN|nr:hypothetical protein D7223_04670 [Micromonospora endolithica]TWJ20178.1 hypothetical protein JD76_00273 [Micromonospora endolithica]
MARAQQNQKATTVRTATSSRGVRTRSTGAVAVFGVSALAATWAVTMLTGVGSTAYAYGFFFTEFFAGVIALVALSLTVMMGLLATDRLVLLIRHRVLLQSAHRATGILGVAGLLFHVVTKVLTGRASATDAVVPFVGGRGVYVGLGTVAALLMVSVLWTGLIRARFAGVGPKWLWRVLHSAAYLAWPFAIFHGLNAGRPAAAWVTLSYLACVLLVVVALLVRLSVSLGRRSREQQQAAARNRAMAARLPDDTNGRLLLKNLSRRDKEKKTPERTATWAETTVTGTWTAPGSRRRDPERFTVPVVPEPGTLREPSRRRDVEEELEPAARSSRRRESARESAPAERSSRRRTAEPSESRSTRRRDAEREQVAARRSDEERTSRRDADVETTSTGRRYRDDDQTVRSGRRSRADAESRYPVSPPIGLDEPEEPWDSPRRWESTAPVSVDPISAGPISAGPISAGPISAAPRSGAGRHSAEDDLPEVEPDYWRPPARYVPDEAPPPVDDTPTLVDLASRRARRAAGDSRSSRRRKANAAEVDSAYWAGLRGEAK